MWQGLKVNLPKRSGLKVFLLASNDLIKDKKSTKVLAAQSYHSNGETQNGHLDGCSEALSSREENEAIGGQRRYRDFRQVARNYSQLHHVC